MENFHIGWPEGILLVLALCTIATPFFPEKGEVVTLRRLRVRLLGRLIGTSLWLGLLYWGGFFS